MWDGGGEQAKGGSTYISFLSTPITSYRDGISSSCGAPLKYTNPHWLTNAHGQHRTYLFRHTDVTVSEYINMTDSQKTLQRFDMETTDASSDTRSIFSVTVYLNCIKAIELHETYNSVN